MKCIAHCHTCGHVGNGAAHQASGCGECDQGASCNVLAALARAEGQQEGGEGLEEDGGCRRGTHDGDEDEDADEADEDDAEVDPLVGVLEFLGESAREAVLLVDGAADSGAVRELATESQRPQRAAAAASLRRTMAAVAAGGIGDGVE